MSYLRSRNPRVRKSISSYFIEFVAVLGAILISAYLINSRIELKEKEKQEIALNNKKQSFSELKSTLSTISRETEKEVLFINAYLSANRYKTPLDSLEILLQPCISACVTSPYLSYSKDLLPNDLQIELQNLTFLLKQDSKLINERVLPYAESHFDFLKYQQNPKLKRVEFYPSTLDAMLSNSLIFKREALRKSKDIEKKLDQLLTQE